MVWWWHAVHSTKTGFNVYRKYAAPAETTKLCKKFIFGCFVERMYMFPVDNLEECIKKLERYSGNDQSEH
jgi:hypothetical protein